MLAMARAALILTALTTPAKGGVHVWKFKKKGKNEVTFLAVGNPGFLRINGEGAYLEGECSGSLEKFSGNFEVDLKKLTTGIDLRDEHMHDKYLETKKHKSATLVITNQGPIELSRNFEWAGSFTLKDKTNPVKGTAMFDGKRLTASFSIALDEYPVGIPSWLGVTIARDVAISVDAEVE